MCISWAILPLFFPVQKQVPKHEGFIHLFKKNKAASCAFKFGCSSQLLNQDFFKLNVLQATTFQLRHSTESYLLRRSTASCTQDLKIVPAREKTRAVLKRVKFSNL